MQIGFSNMADDLAECVTARLRIVVNPLAPLLYMAAISGYLAVTIACWIHSASIDKRPSEMSR